MALKDFLTSKPGRIAEDQAALEETIPVAVWQELRQGGLIHPLAPVPGEE